jgi:MFS family permease
MLLRDKTAVEALAPQTAPDPRRWWALALLSAAFFMVILDAAIVIVALPSIEADLAFSEQGLQWVISDYSVTFAGLLLLGGRAPTCSGAAACSWWAPRLHSRLARLRARLVGRWSDRGPCIPGRRGRRS